MPDTRHSEENASENKQSRSNAAFPILSFFCGPGGLDLGFEREGFKVVLALDHDDAAVATHNLNNGNVARKCDLSVLSPADVLKMVRETGAIPRGIVGGPPCQSFSRGNTNKKRKDPRARLGVAYAKLIAALNQEFGLDFIVFENVVGLRSKRHRSRLAMIQRELRRAGFNLFLADLDAQRFGVPQHRRRLIIVGVNREKFPWFQFRFPEGTGDLKTVRQTIEHLPPAAFFSRELTPETIPFHPNHWTMNPRSRKFRSGAKGKGRSFRRLDWDKPSLTVAYGNREIHVHPEGHRRLSILEAMLLQGFPETYRLTGTLSEQVSQISDAVPPPLAKAIAASIVEQLYLPIAALQKDLLNWFRTNRRDFPWRRTTEPFRVLIAEKLLQQTAANATVAESFTKLLEAYPDAQSLACGDEMTIRGLISQLGFSYRASELVRLGGAVRDRHGGHVPSDYRELVALPGIGEYCARAVLSFAYNRDVAVLDTNVARFLTRHFGLRLAPSQNPARSRVLQHIADALVPDGRSRDFNWAVLDLCAKHCRSRQPICENCPLRKGCSHAATIFASQNGGAHG